MRRFALASALPALLYTASLSDTSVPAHRAPRSLSLDFTYRATVPVVPAETGRLDLWVPIPSDNGLQTITDVRVEAESSYRITKESRFGNRMVYLHVERPSAPLEVRIQFGVNRREAQVLAPDSGSIRAAVYQNRPRAYLGPDSHVPVGGRYGAIADQQAAGRATALDKARALFNHVVETMQYDYKRESPRLGEGDVPFVCDYKKGNCSDLHSYLISLLRSEKIPAFLEYGFPIAGIPIPDPLPREGAIAGYHCWTWVHDREHGWLPLDASDGRRWLDANRPDNRNRLFGNLILERSAVAFSRGRDINLSPRQKAGPLNYFIYPYAEADGKSVKTGWDVRYRLVDSPSSPNLLHVKSSPVADGLFAGQAP